MPEWRRYGVACCTLTIAAAPWSHARPQGDDALAAIATHDNRVPAGTLAGDVLSLDLVAVEGAWYPEGPDGPAHEVQVFGEEGRPPSNPGPLLRVPAGTEVRATVRNAIGGMPLVVHGLHGRPGAPAPLTVPAGESRSVTFRLSAPGTYLYWGTTRGARTVRDRWGMESQLSGAIVVDPPGGSPPDHVFVVGVEDDSAAAPADRAIHAAVVNGRSWPHGGTVTTTRGDTVRTRWINASDRPHPMHLHGFYFTVVARGDVAADSAYGPDQRRLAVTELVQPGTTMAAVWVPDRPGNWLFHCHMAAHMSPMLRHGGHGPEHPPDAVNHALQAMAGIVTGWHVVEPPGAASPAPRPADAAGDRRALRLLVQSAPGRYGSNPALGFVHQTDAREPRADSVVVPGVPLVLTRGEPVQITVVNRLAEPTSVHWHGIELDSYFDGVSGWSGVDGGVAPHIAPGDSFVVRFTPPRAGTFIYHTHFAEERQLSSGLYGPLLVLEPGRTYDPDADRTWVLSQQGPARETRPSETLRPMLNGMRSPVIEMEAGRRYRIRLINIQPNLPTTFALLADSVPVRWRVVAKDGADLPAVQAVVVPASLRIGVGEAYDFEFTPQAAGELALRAADPGGKVVMSGVVRVRPRGSSGSGSPRHP